MKIVKPHIKIYEDFNPEEVLNKIETSARICYQSEPKGDRESTLKFIKNIINRGHESVLEHVFITFDVRTNRAIHLENVRHRIASYSAESTRYCKYNSDDISFIEPIGMSDELKEIWKKSCEESEKAYNEMMEHGATAQIARDVLNHSLKVDYRVTMDFRSFRNFLKLRCDKAAHPEFKIITIPLLLLMKTCIPVVFDDIEYDEKFYDEFLDNCRWNDYVIPNENIKSHLTKINNKNNKVNVNDLLLFPNLLPGIFGGYNK